MNVSQTAPHPTCTCVYLFVQWWWWCLFVCRGGRRGRGEFKSAADNMSLFIRLVSQLLACFVRAIVQLNLLTPTIWSYSFVSLSSMPTASPLAFATRLSPLLKRWMKLLPSPWIYRELGSFICLEEPYSKKRLNKCTCSRVGKGLIN